MSGEGPFCSRAFLIAFNDYKGAIWSCRFADVARELQPSIFEGERGPIAMRTSLSGLLVFFFAFPFGPVAASATQTVASSDEDPAFRIELFAGYSHLPETRSSVQSFSDSGHGVAVSLSVELRQQVSLVVDFDTHAWTVHGHGTETFFRGDQNIHLTYVSLGPRVGVRRGWFSAFALVSGDLQWSQFSEQTIIRAGIPDRSCCAGSSSGAFGWGFGGGVDLNLTNRIAVRAFQVNYAPLAFGEGPGRKIRIKTGIVFKFD